MNFLDSGIVQKDMTPITKAEILWLIYDFETENFDRTHCFHLVGRNSDSAIVLPEHKRRSDRHALKWYRCIGTLAYHYGVHATWQEIKSDRQYGLSEVKTRIEHLSPKEKDFYDEVMRICTQVIAEGKRL